MLGIIFIVLGTFLDEISASFGKWEVGHKKESIYTYGFLNYFWVLVFFIILCLFTGNFVFSLQSIPLLIVYLIFEAAQLYSSLHAVVEADRSTFGFIIIGTIPLLLIVDRVMGYDITTFGLVGISIIIFGLLILMLNHGLSKKGIGYVLFSTVNAVITISIYKYLITNYNSVEAQLIITSPILLIFLFVLAKRKSNENPFKFLFKREFIIQSMSRGIAGIATSFAYLFAPASVITSAKRGSSVILSMIAGNRVFHEKHLVIKIISSVFVIAGLVLLLF
jgi:hypothetical protein